MTTLIALTLANGTVHMCDESCYNSLEPECTCICLGLNHGVGLSHAERNVMIETAKILLLTARDYPTFTELRIHFHNLTLEVNRCQHKTLDAQMAELDRHPGCAYKPDENSEPTIHQPDQLEQAHADPTKAAQAARNEPDR